MNAATSHPMRLISVNAGEPRIVPFHDKEVATGIFKSAVSGPVLMRRLNLDGDRQADQFNHGGRNKAVYAYASEHYDFWRAEFPGMDLPWGMFGENLTTEGLLEDHACIGDELRVGEAVVAVTQPRTPCFKLGIRFGRDDIVKRFFASRRSGIYFAVLDEGLVQAGDTIEFVRRVPGGISVADVNRAFADGRENLDLLRRIVESRILPDGLHNDLAEELAILGG